MNLSQWGGPYNGALIDSAVQEYNLKTGKLLYTWDALKHIPLGQSQASLTSPWDAYHINSIDVPGDGTFLVSMRDTWAVYKVNIASSKILWTLGGRQSDFKFGPGAEFEWQHDVRMYPGTSLMTVFDDHCCQLTGGGTYVAPTGNSRGLVLKVNTATHTATLADQYIYPHLNQWHPPDYMGSIQPVSGGNEFVGWGSTPYFTEYTPAGKEILDGVLPGSDQSYRAYLNPWVGLPLSPPAGAARQAGGRTTVYVSWNGATQVVRWRLEGQGSGGGLAPIATVNKTGFETTIPVSGSYRTFEVQALDSNGHTIGVSKKFTVS
jgi:hypothetical protein